MARLTLERQRDKEGRIKKGHADEWKATLEGRERPGVGRSRIEAIGSRVSANIEAFGISERRDIDPESATEVVVWRSGRVLANPVNVSANNVGSRNVSLAYLFYPLYRAFLSVRRGMGL